jgi:hypothetical protein
MTGTTKVRRLGLVLVAAGLGAAGASAPVGAGATPTPESYGFDNEAVTVVRADTWHHAGITGDGVTVGIIGNYDDGDWDAAALRGELPPADELLCEHTFAGHCDEFGTAVSANLVAEVVHDLAPDATLAVAAPADATELAAAAGWLESVGTDIVVRPTIGRLDGAGDGTGATDDVFDDLVDAGITVVQAAGDGAARAGGRGAHYEWTYADEDHDHFVEFAPGDETLTFRCGTVAGLRWDDFGEGVDATNYDLWVREGTFDFKRGMNRQDLGAAPFESGSSCISGPYGELRVEVVDEGADLEGDVLELVGSGGGFEYSTNAGSVASSGADSTNPGVLTVGAVDPPLGLRVAPTSSVGPTPDARHGVDLVAPSCRRPGRPRSATPIRGASAGPPRLRRSPVAPPPSAWSRARRRPRPTSSPGSRRAPWSTPARRARTTRTVPVSSGCRARASAPGTARTPASRGPAGSSATTVTPSTAPGSRSSSGAPPTVRSC